MSIGMKILLSIAAVAIATALAIGAIALKSIVAVAAVVSALCATAVFIGLYVADNSNQARILAAEVYATVSKGDAAMKRMSDAIEQLKASSDNTDKVIKAIDGIAFQTNLLTFNAAVEAARAEGMADIEECELWR